MKRLLFIAFMTLFIASAANAQDDCCGNNKCCKECCKGKKCCEGEAQAAAPKAVSFEFNQPSGMRMFADNEGNRYTTPGELSLKKEADGNKLFVRRGIKKATIMVDDSVMCRVGEMIVRYKVEENRGNYNDSEVFVTDVGSYGFSAKLEGGKLFWGSFPSFYEVKDKEKMERYQALRSGVNVISGYLQSLVPEEMLK